MIPFVCFRELQLGLGFEYKQVFLYFTFYLSCQDALRQIAVRQSEYNISFLT